jgi:hypothetical protein
MRQTRTSPVRRESATGFKCQISSTSYTANRLFDANITFEWYEIDYFNRSSAEQFIDNYLDRGRYQPHRNRREDFELARNTLFQWLENSVPQGVDPTSLTGYAPVLRFIAGLLDIGNPFGQVQQLKRESERDKPAAPLAKIALGILERDMRKVVDEEPNRDLKQAYQKAKVWTPDEQCIRFLAEKTGYALETRLPKELPDALRSAYEESVRSWVTDHPFHDHPLFEDYVYAWLFSGNVVEKGLAEAVREYLKSEQAEYRPTPLLLWFASQTNPKDGPSEQISIDAGDFGFLYESVLADAGFVGRAGSGPSKTHYPRLTLSSQDSGSPLVGEIEFPAPVGAAEKTSGRKVRLDLQNTGSALWFWHSLLAADIAVADAVRIGTRGADFVLGPDVDLECDAFACDAATVRVTSSSEQEGVVLLAQRYVGDAVPQLSTDGNGMPHLRVGWQPLRYPWNRFPLPENRGARITGEVRAAFLKLRRFLMLFQAQGHAQLARSSDLIENPAFAGSGLARKLLDYCLERKLVRKVGVLYELSRQELDDRGISWEDLRGHRISSSIASFLTEFLKWRGQ